MPHQASPLRVESMRIIWRDTFIVQDAPRDFQQQALSRLSRLAHYLADSRMEEYSAQPEFLRLVERVSRSVASLGYPDLARIQFASLRIANLRPTLDRFHCPPQRLTENQVRRAVDDAYRQRLWLNVTPFLVLHRAGVGIMEYHATVETDAGAGLTPEEAIEIVRMGLYTQLMGLPGGWDGLLPDALEGWNVFHPIATMNGPAALTGLRDLTQLTHHCLLDGGRRHPAPRPPRPTGSTSVILLRTDPLPGDDIAAFVGQHAPALRGIGSMDTDYGNRASWLVERELGDNLSTDAEVGVYLLGTSELMLFNHRLAEVNAYNVRRQRLEDKSLAPTYFYMHYAVLLMWIYFQEAILRAYIYRLDALAGAVTPDRKAMVRTLHDALADLIQYQENITPYATRIEFLERARAYHQLDQLGGRFERKQDLLLSYTSEYHDFREASAAEFLNWLAAVLAGGELGNLIVNAAGIEPSQNVPLYLAVTLGSIGLAMVVMAVLRLTRKA